MGVRYKAYAILGVQVPADRMFVTSRVRGCDHMAGLGAYCGACGRLTWLPSREPRPGYDYETFKGLKVFTGPEGHGYVYVAALSAEATDYDDVAQLALLSDGAVPEAAARLKAVLDPEGLWDAGTFGLWAVLDAG